MNTSLPACSLAVLAALLLPALTLAAEPGYLCETVKPGPDYPGKLPASTVCMRSLSPRVPRPDAPYDTLQAIRDFHVTRLEWTYGLTKEFIQQVRALGCTVSGAANNMTLSGLDHAQPEWYLAYSALDLDGKAVEAPWMRPWKGHALWHCVNNPAARQAYLAYAKSLVDLGTTDLQRDDPSMNINATNWGGCFCPDCLRGFTEYLRAHGDPARLRECGVPDPAAFNYADYLRARQAPVGDGFRQYPRDYLKALFLQYQEQSTLDFHRWWRQELNAYAGRVVPVTANNGVDNFSPLYLLFDGFIGELNYREAEPEALWEAAARCRELGKGLTTTMPLLPSREETPEWVRRVRQTIAMVYALGLHIEAPWDTYLPIAEETPARYFGRAEDYADLFAQVRACPELLDGYEEAAVAGVSPGAPLPGPVSAWSRDGQLCAVTRALPGRREAPLVVHLVDWSAEPAGGTVSLDPSRLFAGRPCRLSLLTPRPYDRPAHDAAQDSGQYQGLVERTVLGEGLLTTVNLPPLRPWGLLVVEPLPARQGLRPPWFASDDDGRLVLRAAAGATVRYTTDGTVPEQGSALYAAPLPVPPQGELRARAWLGAEASEVSVLAHLPRGLVEPQVLLRNGDFRAGLEAWRVVNSLNDPRALTAEVVPQSPLGEGPAAQLKIAAADGVPYHLRLVQPFALAAGSRVQVRAALVADRPVHVRLGLQEVAAPFRVVSVREFDLTTTPQQIRLAATSTHPDLQVQFQLDLGSAEAPATVWLSGAQVRAWPPEAR